MGKPTGFMEFERLSEGYEPVEHGGFNADRARKPLGCTVRDFDCLACREHALENGAPLTRLHARCEDLKKMFSDAGAAG
mgnify:CR=1 FL=1